MSNTGPVWAEVRLNSIAHNIKEIRRITNRKAGIMAVVKADAYGHGDCEAARVLLANGADCLAVARVSEGVRLRNSGFAAPILILGYTPPRQFRELLRYELSQTVYDLDTAFLLNEEAGRAGVRAKVHIKVDTGMGRLGVHYKGPGAPGEIEAIARLQHLDAEGLCSHFATADSADKTYAREQFENFVDIAEELKRRGLEFPFKHCANSAAIIDMPETHLDLVRPGIVLYGLYPSEEIHRERISLRPVMVFKTSVAQVKKVPSGFKISYGATYTTPEPTIIATITVGYADGYSRLLSSKGEVLIHGHRARVVGRVCMDQCMVDVGHIPDVSAGDEVVLFGPQGQDEISVEEVARWWGTINYEVVCQVGTRVPRLYIE